MIFYYLKNTSHEGPYRNILLYAYNISHVIFVNPLLRFFY